MLAVLTGDSDGEHVTVGSNRKTECVLRPLLADAAGCDRLAQRRRVRPGAEGHLLRSDLRRSVPGLSCAQPGQARHGHRRRAPDGGKLHLRADQRQQAGPEIVILRSHSASLH